MKLCSLACTFLASLAALSVGTSTVNGDDELLEWLDANSAMVAIANDVGAVVDYVVDSGLFEDPYFESAMRHLWT